MQVLPRRGALPRNVHNRCRAKIVESGIHDCNDLSDLVKSTQLRESFIGAVCAYVEKWDPYFHHEVIDLYLEQQNQP